MKRKIGGWQMTKMMSTRTYLFIFLLIIVLVDNVNSTTHREESNYSLPGQWIRKQDSTLPRCKSPYSVCAIVEDPIWYKPRAKRLCRCRDSNSLCPLNFTSGPNGQTISFNGRAQFKFCSDVTKLPTCIGHQIALVKQEIRDNTTKDLSLEANCYCPYYFYHYEYLISRTSLPSSTTQEIEHYRCKKLRHCKTGEFCGHITEDTFQPYYICSCPRGNMCLIKDKKKSSVKELLYDGLAYKGICTSSK